MTISVVFRGVVEIKYSPPPPPPKEGRANRRADPPARKAALPPSKSQICLLLNKYLNIKIKFDMDLGGQQLTFP